MNGMQMSVLLAVSTSFTSPVILIINKLEHLGVIAGLHNYWLSDLQIHLANGAFNSVTIAEAIDI